MQNIWKNKYTLKERIAQTSVVLDKYYPNKVPVLLQVVSSNKDNILIDKHKYLLPASFSVSSFIYLIKTKYMVSKPEIALFLFTENNSILSSNDTFGKIYDEQRNMQDNFLYVFVSCENTFG